MSVISPKNHAFKAVTKKAIVSGNIVEIYEYENKYYKGFVNSATGRANQHNTSNETKQENREKVLNRARSRVRRLVSANPDLNKFFTLTFKENITDLKTANIAFKQFIQRLNYYCKKHNYSTLKYIAVVEFQKRGAIHYHLICNLHYIKSDILTEIWGNGFVKINKIDNVDNVGAYVTKYMQKDSSDNRLIGNRSYFTSKGLKEYTEITDDDDINDLLVDILENEYKRCYETEFKNDILGKIKYKQYVLYTAYDIETFNAFKGMITINK